MTAEGWRGTRQIERKCKEKCLHEVKQTFDLWHDLDLQCKQQLYDKDHRWHEHAMRLEQEDAERFCRQAECAIIHDDTYPVDMASDLYHAQMKVCKGQSVYFWDDITQPRTGSNDFVKPADSISDICLVRVQQTFRIWHDLGRVCKLQLYAKDHRWHDHAMRLEQDDAERFCREGDNESIALDTFPADMKADLIDAINRSKAQCADL